MFLAVKQLLEKLQFQTFDTYPVGLEYANLVAIESSWEHKLSNRFFCNFLNFQIPRFDSLLFILPTRFSQIGAKLEGTVKTKDYDSDC